MDIPRILAGTLAVNRIAFGAGYVIRPESAEKSWLGKVARVPATKVMTCSQGIRDVVLGAGALLALTRGQARDARIWVAGHALADATDFAATWAARKRLPKRAARLALGVAGASTAIGAAAAAGIEKGPGPSP